MNGIPSSVETWKSNIEFGDTRLSGQVGGFHCTDITCAEGARNYDALEFAGYGIEDERYTQGCDKLVFLEQSEIDITVGAFESCARSWISGGSLRSENDSSYMRHSQLEKPMCGRARASFITPIGYNDVPPVATYGDDAASDNGRKAEEVEDNVDVFKPSQQVVERVEVVQEMAKEDEEKGKDLHTARRNRYHKPRRCWCRYSQQVSRSCHPSAQTWAHLMPRVLARMDNLRSLTLPSFDLYILHHHSAFGLRHVEFGNTRLSGQAEAELLMWLDSQTNVVPLRFPFLLDDDDKDASPPTPLPATPTRTRLLSAPTTPSQPFLFPMPPLSPIPPTPTPTRDTFTHTAETLLSNLTTLHGPPRLIILLATSRPLIDASITISTPIYAVFRPTTALESLPPSVRRLHFSFKSVGKRTEEKTLRSAIVVCPAIEELEIEGEGGEEYWYSIVPHFKSLRVLVMRIPGVAQVKTVDERFPLPKRARTRSTSSTISHSGHSAVVSERARVAGLANACPAPRRLPKRNTVAPSISPSPPLPIHTSDDDSLFYKPSPSRQSSSMQRCHEQVEVEAHGAGKMVMVLV
ncbi:hypothetical protein ARMGADRAFT_1035914 [Armillaria gallica]|uniref:Uncharacterized protein n=1 Tax=Armillaria gallica TaxID=47427 RepID=A0A2H3D549_ARMGA|nr:hypothetical protein ARMGADRAFT_1035914 [Armillaria gallica]